jgi:hypothetical protein
VLKMIDIPVKGTKGELIGNTRCPQIENLGDLQQLFDSCKGDYQTRRLINAINFGIKFTFVSFARRKWFGIHSPFENEMNLNKQKESHE